MFMSSTLILTATTLMYCFGNAPTQEHRDLTLAERVVLDTPEVITLALTPLTRRRAAGVYEKDSVVYKRGARIVFDLVGTNTSMLTLTVKGWDTFSQNRPVLFRDGQEVGYRKGLDDVLNSKEKEPSMEIIHLKTMRLETNQAKSLEHIDLGYWYEHLAPGHYQLSTKHRFIHAGKWVESSSLTFEIGQNAN